MPRLSSSIDRSSSAFQTLKAHNEGLARQLRDAVGKAALGDWTLDRARDAGTATLRIVGVEGDASAPTAGVRQLCERFADLLPDLPATATATLDGGTGEPPPRLALSDAAEDWW